jgi:hypothetical protein
MAINQLSTTANRNKKTIISHNSFLNGFFPMREDCNYAMVVISICKILYFMFNSGVAISNKQ